MNILVQNPYMHAGGAENRIRTLLQTLIRRNDIDEVHFMFVGPEARHQVEGEGKFHYWQVRNGHTSSTTKTILKNYDIDVIQLHNNQLIGTNGIKIGQKVGIPTVWVMHDFWTLCPQRFMCDVWMAEDKEICHLIDSEKCVECVGYYEYIKTKKQREIVNNCTVGIVPSERIKNIFYDNDFMIDKLRVVEPWIDLGLFQPAFEIAKKPYQVLFASGNFIPHKGFRVLMRAWEFINRRLPEASLIAIGDQRCMPETIAIAKKLELQNLNLIGHIPQDQLRKIYYESAITVFPSIWEETIGLVWIESLAVGTPVLCSKTGSIPELLKYGGEMFQPGNHVELAEKLMDFLMSPSKRAKYAREGYDYVHNSFNPARAADDFTKLYYELELIV